MKKSKFNTSESKDIDDDFLYEIPTNQTPEDLMRIDNSLESLKSEIQRLQSVLTIQNSQIVKIEKEIVDSKQENNLIKNEINKVKLNTKKLINDSDPFNFDNELNRKGKFIKDCLSCSGIKANKRKNSYSTSADYQDRIEKLYKILEKNNQEYGLLEKRLDVAEGLLGLKNKLN
ncbi:hypothetical protein SteCoe_24829 [Stentor coeruleus]|uniref:Uncharacterized protein n=1 Tax=Stentor coeruleus TaxID=5963 RepID=A0A1R2BGN0_9CILI|nr:hypothetical protein SteCoe_24829 [Stentor coeruleus]